MWLLLRNPLIPLGGCTDSLLYVEIKGFFFSPQMTLAFCYRFGMLFLTQLHPMLCNPNHWHLHLSILWLTPVHPIQGVILHISMRLDPHFAELPLSSWHLSDKDQLHKQLVAGCLAPFYTWCVFLVQLSYLHKKGDIVIFKNDWNSHDYVDQAVFLWVYKNGQILPEYKSRKKRIHRCKKGFFVCFFF